MKYGHKDGFTRFLFMQNVEDELSYYIDKDNPHLPELKDWLDANVPGYSIGQAYVINLWYEIKIPTRQQSMLFKMTFV